MLCIVFASVAISDSDFYDRYLINSIFYGILLCTILLQITYEETKNKIPTFILLAPIVLMFFITVFINRDYYQFEGARWKLAYYIQQERGIKVRLFVSNTYTRLMHVSEHSFDELGSSMPIGLNYKCYIQPYTTVIRKNVLLAFLEKFESSRTFSYFFINPTILYSKTTAAVEPVKYHKDDIFKEISYSSPLYSFVGKSRAVGVYCTD